MSFINDEAISNYIIKSVESLREEAVKTVSDLVKIPSINPMMGGEPGKENDVNRYMKTIFDSIGIESEVVEKSTGRQNLCGRFKGEGGGRSLLFTGHVDVVPPGDVQKWEEEPFSGKIDDTCIWGRGTVDMKAGNAAAVYALKALQNAGIKLKGDVVFVHAVGEEMMEHETGTTACMEAGYTADAAVLCEPTAFPGRPFEVHIASGGILAFKVIIPGKSCHIGARSLVIRDGGVGEAAGVDAIEKAIIIIEALKNLERRWGQTKSHPLFRPGHFVVGPATIHGGVAPSFLAPAVEIEYCAIYPPTESTEAIEAEIKDCIHNACLNDPWLAKNEPQIIRELNWPAYETAKDEPIAQTLSEAAAAVTTGGGCMASMGPVCDAPFIKAFNIPTAALGIGDAGLAHMENERIRIDDLIDLIKIYALTMITWCGIAQ